MSDITQHDLTSLRRDLQTDMKEANRPIERRQDETNKQLEHINNHLRELNGKVAAHAVRLAAGGQKMKQFEHQIADLNERRATIRRDEDQRLRDDDTNNNRLVSMHDIKVFCYGAGAVGGSITVGWAMLKILPALMRAATGQP